MVILLIANDETIVHSVCEELGRDYKIDVCTSGKEGEKMLLTNVYDLLIVDQPIPSRNGIPECRKLREIGYTKSILFLTNDSSVTQTVLALDSGADDCLAKPFNSAEFKARIRTLIRRQNHSFDSVCITVGDLTLNTERKTFKRGTTELHLRKKEFAILELFMRNAGKPLSREMILNYIWDNNMDAANNTVDVHIKYLRDQIDRKFTKKLIKTVHGFGYMFEKD